MTRTKPGISKREMADRLTALRQWGEYSRSPRLRRAATELARIIDQRDFAAAYRSGPARLLARDAGVDLEAECCAVRP